MGHAVFSQALSTTGGPSLSPCLLWAGPATPALGSGLLSFWSPSPSQARAVVPEDHRVVKAYVRSHLETHARTGGGIGRVATSSAYDIRVPTFTLRTDPSLRRGPKTAPFSGALPSFRGKAVGQKPQKTTSSIKTKGQCQRRQVKATWPLDPEPRVLAEPRGPAPLGSPLKAPTSGSRSSRQSSLKRRAGPVKRVRWGAVDTTGQAWFHRPTEQTSDLLEPMGPPTLLQTKILCP